MGHAAMRARGFSLIEILVVLVVIGLMIGTVSLSVNVGSDPQDVLEEEAQRLQEFSRLAADRAVMTGEPMGLLLLPPDATEAGTNWSWRWLRYRRGQWLAAEEPLDGRELPEDIELSLQVEGQEVNLALRTEDVFAESRQLRRSEEGEPEQELSTVPPSVVFYPGGEVTPFRLTLFNAEEVDQQRILTTERIGVVENLDPDEALLPVFSANR